MHRGTEQLVPLYQSCRANNGTGRLEAKKKDVSIEDCMELARAACQSSFGMEYPSGYGGEDRAECVLGGGIADLIEVGDVDCTAWTNEGNPMGGAFRLAVYSVVGKKDRGGGGQGARAGVRGHPVHDPVLLRGHGAQRGGHLGPDSAGLERHLRLRRLHGSPRLDRRQGPGWQRQQGHDCVLDKRAALPGRLGNGRRGRPVQGTRAQLDREGRSRRGVCAPAAQEVADREGEPDSKGSYVSTCGTCESNSGFYGAMEVMSRVAAQRYVESALRCKAEFGDVAMNGWGEDLFAQRCMNLVGVTCWDR
ncbi:unnamed protein product [Prorocentrum cordatum]|uniref:Uncharacterized protein n=1 Tax=Prorocentrum cordatum TaxID=2364126 RepID=A0ABN9YG76_9DINO|nr:unnamed protein product [Polarella glacialis]